MLGLHGDERGVEVSMGDSGRDGIPRECCGGGEGELNVSAVREKRGSRVKRRERNRWGGGGET